MTDPLLTTSSTSTSSTPLGRVRGFTINLLFALKEGPRRTYELAEISGKTREYVYSYLKRMRKYGLVMKNGFFWNLTVLGSDFISYLEEVSKYSIVCRHIENRRRTEERQKRDTSPLKKLKQVSIQAFLRTSTLHDTEKRVVEDLVDHYNKTGSKFRYFDDHYAAAEFYKCTPDQMVNVMKNLKQDHIGYAWPDPSLKAWKIALYKDFIETLKFGDNTK